MSNEIILGKRIQELRTQHRISRVELADVMMVTQQAVGKWERGESLPDILTMKRLADYLGIKMEDFFQSNSFEKVTNENAGVTNNEKGWDLSMSNWVDIDLTGLENIVEKINCCNIINSKLTRANLKGISFKANSLKNSNFDDVNFSLSKLRLCTIHGSSFLRSRFQDSQLSHCSICDSDFSDADFLNARISFSTIEKCSFHNTALTQSSFKNTLFKDMTIDTDITNCSFSSCQFKNVIFKNMRFTNTFFKNVKLKKCSFLNCTADNISYSFLSTSKADLATLIVV